MWGGVDDSINKIPSQNLTETKRLEAFYWRYYGTDENDELVEFPGYVSADVVLDKNKTAVVIIDPWKDTNSAYIDEMTHQNIEDVVCPLLDDMISKGCTNFYIFSNSPEVYHDPRNGLLIGGCSQQKKVA